MCIKIDLKSQDPKVFFFNFLNFVSSQTKSGSYFNCGKCGHKDSEYRGPKKDKNKMDQANLTESKGEMDNL